MILDDIVAKKKLQLNAEMQQLTVEGWKQRLKRPGLHKPLDFFSAVKRKDGISVIAEIKKASPSKGVIREAFDPVEIAKQYSKADIQAISVLTEKHFFYGDDEYLGNVRQVSPLPILRKDFIIDIWQVYQSRFIGADAILLIVCILSDEVLKKLLIVSKILGLHCLVEVHDEKELERALKCGANIIGINNRNLKTFEVNIKTTERLINLIPHNRAVVSESGIKTSEDLNLIRSLGADAALIGEAFMASSSITETINGLRMNCK